jgi:hypothetical protein
LAGLSLSGAVPIHRLQRMAPFLTRAARGISQHIGSTGVTPAHNHVDPVAVTDDMLSRVLRTLSSDDWV